MGCGQSQQEEAKVQLLCGGCEKAVESEEQLSPYIGKKYCKDCIKAIKDNNRRTMGTIKKTVSQEGTASTDPGTSTSPPTNTTETETKS